jgi:peptidoglycan/LPS O-acetylase OafA/YrhL
LTDDQHCFQRFTGAGGLTHQPGLDGLRGFAVGAVLIHHLELVGFVGGYVGVSLFFTLSGVLIGSLVLNEITVSGRFSLGAFWLRRARRLLPPALLTVAVLAVARLATAALDATSGSDLLMSALNVVNWHFAAEDVPAGELFGRQTAVAHFWSLAIEEQFYLVGGVLAVLVAARSRRPVRTVGIAAGVIAAVSFAVPFVANLSVNRVFLGTDTRAGELMVGVAGAAWFASPDRRRALLTAGGRIAVAVGAALVAGAAGYLVLYGGGHVGLPSGEWLTSGLLPVTAVVSLSVITVTLVQRGPIAAVAKLRPLQWLGRISYALYVIHWPLIVVANQLWPQRSLARVVVLGAASIGLAVLSGRLLERPIRTRRELIRPFAIAAGGAVALLAVTVSSTGPVSASSAFVARLHATPPPTAPDVAATGLPRVAVFGDAAAYSLLLSLPAAAAPAEFAHVGADTRLACGIAVSPAEERGAPGECADPAGRFATVAAATEADVAVLLSCQSELLAQPIPGSGGRVRTIGDVDFDAHVSTEYGRVTDALQAAGVERVLWVRCPYPSRSRGIVDLASAMVMSRDPERTDRLNELITELADARAGVDVLPFDEWVNDRADDEAIRPDGVHYAFEQHNPAADAFVVALNTALEDA